MKPNKLPEVHIEKKRKSFYSNNSANAAVILVVFYPETPERAIGFC
jgi:hypothetical protein